MPDDYTSILVRTRLSLYLVSIQAKYKLTQAYSGLFMSTTTDFSASSEGVLKAFSLDNCQKYGVNIHSTAGTQISCVNYHMELIIKQT